MVHLGSGSARDKRGITKMKQTSVGEKKNKSTSSVATKCGYSTVFEGTQ
jgi:hypothetical protein